MKKLIPLIGLVLFCLIQTIFAQVNLEITEDDKFDVVIDSILGSLDLNELETGILVESAFPIVEISQFKGTELHDSNFVNPVNYGGLYNMIYDAVVDSNAYLNIAKENFSDIPKSLLSDDTIPISFSLYNYDRIRDDALINNLIQFQGNKFVDVPNRPYSPYVVDTAFAATPFRTNFNDINITFSIPDSLFFSNLDSIIQNIRIDFDDNNGFNTYLLNQVITISYPAEGDKTIKFEITLSSGQVIQSHSKINIAVQIINARDYDRNNTARIVVPGTNLHDGATIDIFYSCPDQKLRKPLVVINGYDPPEKAAIPGLGNRTSDLMFQFMQFVPCPTLNPSTQLEDIFEQQNFDLVWITWINGGEALDRLGYAIEDALIKLNEEKNSSGSHIPNIVIGVSHGGVTGKFALLDMEQKGIDHQTEAFINFDEGILGANLPLGLQYMIKHALNVSPNGKAIKDRIPYLDLLEDVFKARALTDLIRYSAWVDIANPAHHAYFNNIVTMGQNGDGTLSECQYLTICNGSLLGTLQEKSPGVTFSPGDELLNITFKIFGLFKYEAEVNLLPNAPTNFTQIFKGKMVFKIAGIPIHTDKMTVRISGNLPLDTAPGGYMGTPGGSGFGSSGTISSPGTGMANGNIAFGGISNILGATVPISSVPLGIGPFCITPMVSTVDVTDNNIALLIRDLSDIENTVNTGTVRPINYTGSSDNSWPPPGSSQFPFSGGPRFNQQHPTVTDKNSVFFIAYVAPDFGQHLSEELTNRIYNFGKSDEPVDQVACTSPIRKTPNDIDHDVSVLAGGKLNINQLEKISFTDIQSNPTSTYGSTFVVNLIKGCGDKPTLTIDNGGELSIGDFTNGENKGILYVGESLLEVLDGGYIFLDKESKIVIEKGGELKIEAGGHLRLIKGAQIIVETGGKLSIDQDALIDLWWNNSNIHIKKEGELEINGGFDFTGSGFFQFDEDNILTLHSPFILNGMNKGTRFIRLNKNATLHIDHHGIFLEDGRVDYEDYSRILQGPGGMARFVHTDFKGLGQDNSIALETDDAEQVFVFQCTFYDLDRGLQLRNMGPGQTASVQYSNFTNNLGGIAAENVDRITLTECDIDAGATGIAGLDLFDVGDMSLVNTDVHHFPYTSGAIRLVNTKRFRMFGGEVADNQLGLLAPAGSGDPNESNVFLYQQATFRHNQIGISMPNGGFDRGLVLMDCAVMWENFDVAIEGVDVELQIDACINSGDPTCSNIRPNVFRPYGGSLYFDICYRERDDDGFIPAKGNYWAAIPAAGAPHGNYYIRESFIPDTTQMDPDCGPLLLLDYSFSVPNMPTGCSYAPDPEDPENPENPENPTIPKDQCFVDDGSEQVLLHDQYNQAYEVFRDTLGNPDGFVPIAGISNTIRDTATYTCRRYIDIARAIVDASAPPATEIDIDDAASLAALDWEPGVLRKLESRQYGKARPASSRMLLYPNPVREELTVTAGRGRYELRVYDLLGRLKHSRRMDGNSKLNVTSWLSGVYMVQLTDLSSFEVQQGRFVVR